MKLTENHIKISMILSSEKFSSDFNFKKENHKVY